jgi:hypothetical protein
MAMKRIFSAVLLVLACISGGCTGPTDASGDNPRWVTQLIQSFQSNPVGNPPQSIWRYEYKGQTVYYVPAQCCDQFSTLYNEFGMVIGAPDGGFGGGGDGRCSDFFDERKNGTLIWSDPRGNKRA